MLYHFRGPCLSLVQRLFLASVFTKAAARRVIITTAEIEASTWIQLQNRLQVETWGDHEVPVKPGSYSGQWLILATKAGFQLISWMGSNSESRYGGQKGFWFWE
jgi:hypothetical protein